MPKRTITRAGHEVIFDPQWKEEKKERSGVRDNVD